jgi:hypothetical protein
VIEGQGWDDEDANRKRTGDKDQRFTSSKEEVVRNEYVSEYLSRKQANGDSYVGTYWILRFGP